MCFLQNYRRAGFTVDFISVFNAFSEIAGIEICFFEPTKIFLYNYGDLTRRFYDHSCRFCNAVRELPRCKNICTRHDGFSVSDSAATYKQPFFSTCPFGLYEYIVPFFKDGELIATVFLGQCRVKGETNYSSVAKRLDAYSGDEKTFRELYFALPEKTKEELINLGIIAESFIGSFVGELKEVKAPTVESLALTANNYILNNYLFGISATDVSKALHVNYSYLSREFKEAYNTTMSDFMLKVRLEHALRLLKYTNITICDIAKNVGINDRNYFARIFKKSLGITPMQYRKKERERVPPSNY